MRALRSPWKHTGNDNDTPLESGCEDNDEKETIAAEARASSMGVEGKVEEGREVEVEVGEGGHKKNFQNLFPSNYSARQGEMALVLWDFLDR